MCENCDKQFNQMDDERKRLLKWILENPTPCIVCQTTEVVGAGTWIADQRRYLAVGSQNADRIFAFSLCENHIEQTEENEKLIMQAIVRMVRSGNGREV